MFEPGHLHRKSLPGMPGPEFDVDVHYEVRHDPSEGKLIHFKMSGHIGGQAFVEEFDMHSDTAFNFASLLSKVAVKHGMPANSSLVMRGHKEFDAMFEDIRAKLDARPGDTVDFDHLAKDGL